MTRAPSNLLAVRSLLLEHLNRDKGSSRDQDLEPNEVGIVGDSAHRGGYHCGIDRVVPNDYSVIESSRDHSGLTEDAAALDVGMFRVVIGGKEHNLQTFSTWCVAQCIANAPDTKGIREIIYSPDGKVVKRWDRLGRRSSGDRSHLWHTHFSFFRDSIKANRDQRPLFRRYLATIKLLEENMDSIFVRLNDKGQGVRLLQRRLERLHGLKPFDVKTKKAITTKIKVDGVFGPETQAFVIAAEKAWNPTWNGNGDSVNAETWTRLDDMYRNQETLKLISKHTPPAPAIPNIDYNELAKVLDMKGLANSIPVPALAAQLAASPDLVWSLTNELLKRLTNELGKSSGS